VRARCLEVVRVLQQVLDLDRDVIGEVRELPMELFPQTDSVADAVKEIRIAESDVLGTTGYLLANVLDDHSTWNDAKPSAIDGDDRAVTAQVFTATAGLCVAHRSTPPLAQVHICITR